MGKMQKAFSGQVERARNKRDKRKHDKVKKPKPKEAAKLDVSDPKKFEQDPMSSVIYLGHIPHGFYQPQITAYFQQFGKVLRVRLSRSKKTMRSRGYAFIEFENKDVARIAAETMNNYLTFERVMKCHTLPKSKVHEKLFKNCFAQMTPWKQPIRARKLHNRFKSEKRLAETDFQARKKLKKTQIKLAKLGIEFDVDLVMTPRAKKSEPSTDTHPANANVENGLMDTTLPGDAVTPKVEIGDAVQYIPFENYILVDSSDDEITFKTPPANVAVLRKKTLSKKIVGGLTATLK